MRFLHTDFDPIRRQLSETARSISALEWDLHPVVSGIALLPWTLRRRSAHGPRTVELSEVEAMFQRGLRPENAGTALPLYFHVNAPAGDRAVSLLAAVQQVEVYGTGDEILLTPYQDGGFISVSRHELTFQHGAAAATWWGP